MAAFRFRLARLKRVRELQEDLARSRWARAERVALEAERRRAEMQERVVAVQEELRMAMSRPVLAPGAVLAGERLLDRLVAEEAARGARAAGLRAEADALRGPLDLARAARRGLERLEERARERHRSELTAAEIAAMDEVAGRRAAVSLAGHVDNRTQA